MKKVLLSLCLLAVVAPQNSKAVDISAALSSTKNALLSENAQKLALISAIFYYILVLKKRKTIDVGGKEWAWSDIISMLGEEGYLDKVIIGNFEKKNEIDRIERNEAGKKVKTVKDKETITKAYGVIGVLDAMILSKLKDVVDFVKNIKEFNLFIADPAKSLGLTK